MTIIDGKHIASAIRSELKEEVNRLREEGRRAPHLVVIIVGHNPASETYVRNKLRACEEVGFTAERRAFEESITEEQLLREVEQLNRDEAVDGFIVQLPLPAHIRESVITAAIDYRKDVDGLHPTNVGRVAQGLPALVSATPKGILTLLRRYNIPTDGQRVVVVGRSNIVGKPMALLLMQKCCNATVTLCHTHTRDLSFITREADIIIMAVGHPAMLRQDMVKEGAVVIDVGINRVEDASLEKGYRLVGDVAFDEVAPKCSFITPVPGGVGPMTIVSLLENTLQAYRS